MTHPPQSFLRSWLGASLVLFAFSERVFWSFLKTDDTASELGITFLAYSLIAGWAIHMIRKCQVKSPDGFFLIGALVGWLSEGVLVNTVYGDGSNPFPMSISFTGLSWHALISIMVGWYWLPRALASGSTPLIAKWAGGLGIAWGLWASYVPTESPKYPVTVQAFASHSVFVIAMIVIGLGLMSNAPLGVRKLDQAKFWTISVLAAAVFAFAWIPIHQIIAVIVLLFFLVTVWALSAAREATELPFWVPEIPIRRLGWFGLSFVLAVLTYSIGSQGGKGIPSNFALYAFTMPAGFFFWIRAISRIVRSRNAKDKLSPPGRIIEA